MLVMLKTIKVTEKTEERVEEMKAIAELKFKEQKQWRTGKMILHYCCRKNMKDESENSAGTVDPEGSIVYLFGICKQVNLYRCSRESCGTLVFKWEVWNDKTNLKSEGFFSFLMIVVSALI